MKNALIIGAAGQDGRLLRRFLSDRAYEVRGWTHADARRNASCQCSVVDILQPDNVKKELRRFSPDEIYYLAAFHHSTEDAIQADTLDLLRRSFDVHVVGLLNVLRGIKDCCRNARLFYAASSHVFGSVATGRQDERSDLKPDSAYGISKAAGIRCCQLYRRTEGVFAATGILFNHESALRKASFVSQKIVRGALRSRLDQSFRLILGDLGAQVDWGYAPDFVEAMFRILQLPEANDFVIASGELHSVGEFAQAAFDEVGLDWRKHIQTDVALLKRRSHPMYGDCGKLRSATGWSPTVNFRELVSTLVQETARTYEHA